MMVNSNNQPIGAVLDYVTRIITAHGYSVADSDLTRPWGGYIRLNDADAKSFVESYFTNSKFDSYENLSPKFLLVAPGKRLSWQKHSRRAEIWQVLLGPVGVKLNATDKEPENYDILATGGFIQFDTNVRHRLIGLKGWGIVAEIWHHTDNNYPSDENDIVRISDDFNR